MSDIPKSMMAVRVHGKGIVCKIPRNYNFVFVFFKNHFPAAPDDSINLKISENFAYNF